MSPFPYLMKQKGALSMSITEQHPTNTLVEDRETPGPESPALPQPTIPVIIPKQARDQALALILGVSVLVGLLVSAAFFVGLEQPRATSAFARAATAFSFSCPSVASA